MSNKKINPIQMSILALASLFVLNFQPQLLAQEQEEIEEIFKMSLEELWNAEIDTGTLTGLARSKVPVSITTITAEDIKYTPARTLLDLIEVYVPGATFVNHWLGPRIGIRGVLGDQNNSYLLLVNGKNMNMKCSNGPIFEIQNKDLNDIERIEIISGPGSVIYGPGAIGGIINIITKNADTSKGLKITAQGNENYRYGNVSVSYGFNNKKIKAYLYGSISRSEGEKDAKFFYVDRAHGYGHGFMGPDWGNRGLGTPSPRMYEDFWGKPEYKLHLDLQFLDEWRFWSRLTTFNYTALQQEEETADGPHFPGSYGSMFSSELENQHSFTDNLTLKSTLGFHSQSHRHILFYQGTGQVADHITQRNYSYSENEANLNAVLNYEKSDKTKISVGGAFYYQYMASEWGMDKNTFILPFPAPIRFAVLDSTSEFHQTYGPYGFTTVIDDRIDGSMFSLFGEVNHEFHPLATILLSARTDKHQYADWAISPRIALISEINERNILKIIGQRSVRLSNFTELYAEYKTSGTSAKPEILSGVEVIYNRLQNENLTFSISAYYNSVDQIAHFLEGNKVISSIELAGFEAGAKYRDDKQEIGLNYSFIHQLDWEPVEEIEAWIVGLDAEQIMLKNYAENRINNLPKHAFKFFYNRDILTDLKLHLNGRICWDYQQIHMLNSFADAHYEYGNAATIQEMNDIIGALKEHGYTKLSFTSNASLNWKLPIRKFDLYLNLYAMNLISHNHIGYVIQYWEPGNNRQYPRQCSFLEEPISVGLKLTARF